MSRLACVRLSFDWLWWFAKPTLVYVHKICRGLEQGGGEGERDKKSLQLEA